MKAAAILLLATSAAHAAPPTAAQTLAGVQKYYATAPQLTAQFKEDVTAAAFGTTLHSQGAMFVAQPASFRFDYVSKTGKAEKSFIYDGKTLYYVGYINREWAKRAASGALPAAVGFLTGASTLTTAFTASINGSRTYGGPADIVVDLVPKQATAGYAHLMLVVDATDFHVRESVVIDGNGNVNDLHFYAPDTKTAIPASQFVVNPAASFSTYKQIP